MAPESYESKKGKAAKRAQQGGHNAITELIGNLNVIRRYRRLKLRLELSCGLSRRTIYKSYLARNKFGTFGVTREK